MALVEVVTFVVLTLNLAEVEPPATVTVWGTDALLLLLARLTVMPPTGAAEPKITVPAEALPPETVVGVNVSDLSTGGLTVRVALCVTDPWVPVIVAIVCLATAVVLAVNVADVFPADTVTNRGTLAAPLLLDRLILIPPDGAAPVRVTVPFPAVRPMTVVGLNAIDWRAGGITVRVAALLVLPAVAVIVACFVAATDDVFTVNVAEVLPAATVSDAGSVATGELLASFTTTPPEGAGPLRDTVPVEDEPPVTVLGLRFTDCSISGTAVRGAV